MNPKSAPLDVKLTATIVHIRIKIALVPNKIFKKMIENKTYFVNEIIINEQIWKPKAINRPAEANSTILDLSKELITPHPQIAFKSKHCQPLILSSPCLPYCLLLCHYSR